MTFVHRRPRLVQSGQSAVSLTAIDGEIISGSTQSNFIGNGWYTRNGYTKATAWTGPNPLGGTFAGWDDPTFIPIQSFNSDAGGSGHAAMISTFLDVGVNTMMPVYGTPDLTLNVSAGIGAFGYIGSYPTPTSVPSGGRAAFLGINGGEEPYDTASWEAIRDPTRTWLAVSGGPGHLGYYQFTDHVLNFSPSGGIYTAHDWVIEGGVLTCDVYYFAAAYDTGVSGEEHPDRYKMWRSLYDPTRDFGSQPVATPAQMARGSNYGSSADALRANFAPSSTRPFGMFVETGAPYEPVASKAITPAQLKWAVWSLMVHGCRLISYFEHSFRPDGFESSNTWLNSHYGTSSTLGTGIYAATKLINQQVLSVATVINSPKDGYFVWGTTSAISTAGFLTAVTSTNARATHAGVDAVCKWHPTQLKHYILSATRELDGSTNIPATYRMVDQGQRTAYEVFENRSVSITRGGGIPLGFCEFSDPFATAASYHCYRID